MWPFKRKSIVDAETAKWHADNFAWLVATFGGFAVLVDTVLVLPQPGFFPIDDEKGYARAVRIFEQVKHYCGMDEWPFHVSPAQESPAYDVSTLPRTAARAKPTQGTFPVADDAVRATYELLLDNPELLIASFAHECARRLLMSAPSVPPCADDEHDFLVHLAAVYLGFGVFMANSVWDIARSHFDANTGRSGYLPEQDVIFATALFIAAKELDPQTAYECLKPHLAKMLKRALRDLTVDTHFIGQIRASGPAEEAGGEQP